MYAAFVIIKEGEIGNKYEEAEKDYIAGMKYTDIATKYGVSIDTVKSWKKRYKWVRKSVHTKCTQKSEKRVQPKTEQIEHEKVTENKEDELTEKQRLFCVFFVKSFNATKAYQKAYGVDKNTAAVNGCRMLRNAKVQNEIKELKEITIAQAFLTEEDILQKYIDLAFSDITDFAEFKGSIVKLKNSNEVDGSLIKEIKAGMFGPSIKLKDSQKALDWLSRYFMMNPMDKHRQEFEKRKMELELLKLEASKTQEQPQDETPDDNFKEVIEQSVKDVWTED